MDQCSRPSSPSLVRSRSKNKQWSKVLDEWTFLSRLTAFHTEGSATLIFNFSTDGQAVWRKRLTSPFRRMTFTGQVHWPIRSSLKTFLNDRLIGGCPWLTSYKSVAIVAVLQKWRPWIRSSFFGEWFAPPSLWKTDSKEGSVGWSNGARAHKHRLSVPRNFGLTIKKPVSLFGFAWRRRPCHHVERLYRPLLYRNLNSYQSCAVRR